ncbi:hypothetical protein [Pseudomonas aeruginosa]|uniref:hypothetical protein n=1 Tax=Pseudomonas aeruginosa TaxID=287 RepID=UPI000F85D021|nr:hypothetical protein [Pseudomonas aeruginosa]RUI11502.1 hypothetical protein IPC447_29925 [Pseudomonas aeruginosa]
MARENSRALPWHAYGDPADIIESREIHALGCAVCVRAVFILGLPLCSSNLKYPACRKDRRNGHKLTPEAGG